jgi:hypothetical protein
MLAVLAASAGAQGQSADHVAAVKAAMDAAPVRASATNGCPAVEGEFLGWPAGKVRRCQYKRGDLEGVLYVLDVAPETMATWIESICAEKLPDLASCFSRTLTCANETSGMSFPVSGFAIEQRGGAGFRNFLFRNGMLIGGPHNAVSTQIPLEEQEKLAKAPEAGLAATFPIPTGSTRFWRTMPYNLAARVMGMDIPPQINTPERRLKWLETARAEMIDALGKPSNRLLDAWVTAHPLTITLGACPDESDP